MRKLKLTAGMSAFFLWGLLVSLLQPNTAHAQNADRKISGKVFSASGKVLEAASVLNKRTNVGTYTNAAGAFTLQGQTGDIIVVSYVGFQRKEVKVTTSDVINIVVTEDKSTMEDVVVIGYGKSKRTSLTTAQNTVSAKDMDRTVNTTFEQAIQGRSPGVYVTQNSGQPGGGVSVVIRGLSTLNGTTEPLYVIDGVQFQPDEIRGGAQSSSNALAGLNPSDIDNMEILQGPSATAIYGTRGANGVVMITTKRGKTGEAKINYGMQYNVQMPPRRVNVMNLQQYAQMVKGFHAIAGGQTPTEFLDSSLLGKGTDWQRELFKRTPMTKHQLSVSGGNDKSTYYLSTEYLNQKGVAAGSGFKRYGFRLNLDNKPREWATIGVNLGLNQTNENLTTSNENVISDALRLTPVVPVRNIDGSWGASDLNRPEQLFAPVNPVAIANLITNNNVRREVFGGLNIAVKLTKDLTFKTLLNTNIGFSNSTNFKPVYSLGWQKNVTATFTDGSTRSTYWNAIEQIDYSKQLAKHNLGVMFAHEAQSGSWKQSSASKTGFLTNDIFDNNAGDPLTASINSNSSDWAIESFLGRFNYNYDSRYFLTGTFRRDASSKFGENNRWASFPSVSAAWRVSQEKFFNVPFINELKLRVETGVVGNQGGILGIYSPLSAGATPSGTGFLPNKYKNPDLKWEETNSTNYGINIGLFKNRIEVEADYFIKNTSNLIMSAPLPWYMGSNGPWAIQEPVVNLGTMQTKGWSFAIKTVNVSNKDFKWESNFNLSAIDTKIKKFNADSRFLSRTSWWLNDWTQRASVGQAPWLFRGYIEEGLFQSIDEINKSALPVDNAGQKLIVDQARGVWVGDVKFKDISGPQGVPDGKINSYDETNIGNPWPKMYGGFSNDFTYKNFTLSVLVTGVYGNDIYNFIKRANTNANNINISRNLLVTAMDYAKPTIDKDGKAVLQNPNTNVARISYGPNDNYGRHTNKWVEDGSFIKIKNISLGYNLPANVIAKQKMVKSIRLMLGVQNIATFTKYTGYDPEVGASTGRDVNAGNQAIGLDNGRYPLTPIYTFNLAVNF